MSSVLFCKPRALAILNVWLLRSGKASGYRGGAAQNMEEEFAVYGLPAGFRWSIGTIKVVLALLLLAGIWVPSLVQPGRRQPPYFRDPQTDQESSRPGQLQSPGKGPMPGEAEARKLLPHVCGAKATDPVAEEGNGRKDRQGSKRVLHGSR